jgi:hypothetical protein
MGFIKMTIIDIVDILMVATIMYYIYKLIRGTNATSILTGIVLIYFGWVVARALNMELMSGILGDVVLNFTFLSTRIISATLFAPMVCALFLPGKVNRTWACIGAIAGPVAVILFTVWTVLPFDSMFAGIAVGVLCCAIGIHTQKTATAQKNT